MKSGACAAFSCWWRKRLWSSMSFWMALSTPIFRPLLRWVSRLRFVIRLQDIVAALPPYAILVLLLVPLAIRGTRQNLCPTSDGRRAFCKRHLPPWRWPIWSVSLSAERIYAAGREKLRTITWFAKLIDWLIGNRDRLLAWARTTWIWTFSIKFKRSVRELITKIRLRFRVAYGRFWH